MGRRGRVGGDGEEREGRGRGGEGEMGRVGGDGEGRGRWGG